MNVLLVFVTVVILGGLLLIDPSDAGAAILLAIPLAGVTGWVVYRFRVDQTFLLRLFVTALLLRICIGSLIYIFQWQGFFGGDALTYDYFGNALLKVWDGNADYQRQVDLFTGGGSASGWGMIYYVGAIYRITGQDMLATQFVNCILGAATAPIAYLTAMEIFPQKRAARVCGALTAYFPSLVLWSSQGLKDGPIVFLLALSMLATLKLGNRFSLKYLAFLALSLYFLLTLRFYVFYIVALAVTVAFILGRRRLTAKSFARQLIILGSIGMALAYFGVSRYASQQYEAYGSLRQLQLMRLDASQTAQSGFAEDVDVSSTTGALSAIPIGLTYLMLAPFPWQMVSPRQIITLPEMIVWWCSIPILVLGWWFSVKHRLREVTPIIIFTTLLTLTYSILQGNVGTAYRQRAQLLVFYFFFVAIGYVLMKEKKEEKAKKAASEREREAARKPKWKITGAPPDDRLTVAAE